MAIELNSPGWKVRNAGASHGSASAAASAPPGLPPEFLTAESRVADEVVLEPSSAIRGRDAGSPGLDLSYEIEPGGAAVLAIRYPSGALTFHRVIESTSRGLHGPTRVRFQVTVRRNATRGVIGQAVKAIAIKIGKVAIDKAAGFVPPKLVEVFEKAFWKKRGGSTFPAVNASRVTCSHPDPSKPGADARTVVNALFERPS